ncbi:hypothetical protein B0H63DRAFT_187846 [Podospora didyma]|uniref:Uncharacterized protein n=1 Tax=Podospora didyma TaxID=330526 RepID=A0AAE0NQJ5_9PEZI|nr:hypothetical protein B0H63DRAFT_187846 [Podospora didyma]
MATSSTAVPLGSSISRRFYEPAVLYACLTKVHVMHKSTKAPDLETTAGKSNREAFYIFVDKLAQICDSKRGGDTVTAVAVLQHGRFEYRFTSNKRSQTALDETTEYLTDILQTLGEASDYEIIDGSSHQEAISALLLEKILKFNAPRIRFYVKVVVKSLEYCIRSASQDRSVSAILVERCLRELEPFARSLNEVAANGTNEFARHGLNLLHAIDERFYKLEGFIKAKASVDPDADHGNPWANLRHSIGRLQSYVIAVDVLISARKQWPQIFGDFFVTAVPSSKPGNTPNLNAAIKSSCKKGDEKKPTGPAFSIIGRMTSDPTEMETYRHHGKKLQAMGLDQEILKVVKEGFRPVVHAEVHLLDALLRDDQGRLPLDERPPRFFGEAEFGRYIGASKPTCQLCSHYFKAHPLGVEVRPPHPNFYLPWRPPHVYKSDSGEAAAVKARNKILEQMIVNIRDATFKTIKDMAAPWRKNDSSDTPSSNPFQRGLMDVPATLSMMAHPSRSVLPATTGPQWSVADEYDDNDELVARMGQLAVHSGQDLRYAERGYYECDVGQDWESVAEADDHGATEGCDYLQLSDDEDDLGGGAYV